MIKLLAFDLDGTLYIGDRAIPGAVELVRRLRGDHRVVYFTNNSTRTNGEIREKLAGLGFACEQGEVYTSASATAVYLREARLDNIYLIGSPGLRAEIEAQGRQVVGAAAARHLVVGLDPDFNYQKLSQALTVLSGKGKFIACNEDMTFPAGPERRLPGCGPLVAALAAAARRRPDFVVGKPNTYMLDRIAADWRVKPGEIMVVGDSFESDIAMALKYHSPAVLLGGRRHKTRGVRQIKRLGELGELLRRQK